jgi:hypothetical protein
MVLKGIKRVHYVQLLFLHERRVGGREERRHPVDVVREKKRGDEGEVMATAAWIHAIERDVYENKTVLSRER